MDRFEAMQVFVKVAELASFTRAAEQLELPRATVTHTEQALEKHLGVRLLQRTTRHVGATPDGEAYLQRCIQLLADLQETEDAFGRKAGRPSGKLRVDLQGTLATHFLLPRIVQLPRYHVEGALAAGTLREVLAAYRPAPLPVSVLYPHSRQLSPRVRVFVDWVSERMQRSH